MKYLEDKVKEVKSLDSRYALFGTLFLLSNQLETVGSSFLGELTAKQWFLLVVLGTFFKEPPSIRELSEWMGTSHQNVKQLAVKLEQKGYVTIARDERDNRILRVSATSKADEFEREYHESNERFIGKLYQNVSEMEVAAAFSTLARLSGNLEEISEALLRQKKVSEKGGGL